MWKNIYKQEVTILNKLKRADIQVSTVNDTNTTNNETNAEATSSSSSTQTPTVTVDKWYKYTVDNAVWYEQSARNSGGNGVYIGTYITVLIPFNDNYVDYRDWRHLTEEERQDKFTMSSGDYIVLGEVTEEINASNVVAVMNDYGILKCMVKHIRKPHKRFNATVQLKVEGV